MSASKDISFFDKAYVSYFHCIEHYAYTFLRNGEESKSLAQDVFIKFWEKIDIVDRERDPLPYLMTITKNSCLNILRHKKNHDSYISYKISKFYQDVLSSSASSEIYLSDVQKIIQETIGSMPEKVRSTFILSKINGLKNKEIAACQNISISSVEFRISYAFKVLRKKLKDYLPFLLWFLPF